ncbi:MAG: hypothetical protein DLM63_00075 [Solirubrobacterales bacterium]|nr:MAG: hypothetical protein DLM63_00075 [Solirubrobacterales bacterium]
MRPEQLVARLRSRRLQLAAEARAAPTYGEIRARAERGEPVPAWFARARKSLALAGGAALARALGRRPSCERHRAVPRRRGAGRPRATRRARSPAGRRSDPDLDPSAPGPARPLVPERRAAIERLRDLAWSAT